VPVDERKLEAGRAGVDDEDRTGQLSRARPSR
jgi:hypothetical protein